MKKTGAIKLDEERVYIGCGAGFAGDRVDGGKAVVGELARKSGQRFLIYETLAERTLALAHLRQMNGEPGYLPRLEAFLRPVLAQCLKHNIRIIGNFGAADPEGACRHIIELCNDMGLKVPKLMYVCGDDIMDGLPRSALDQSRLEHRDPVSANVYIGAASIVEALDKGADIVVTGRVADPSLVLGPLVYAWGWDWTDWDLIAAGTLCGHILECCAQVSGGYFADPGIKDVFDLARVGFPIAEVASDGTFIITKPPGTGGCVNSRTVREQILYEIDDPARYITPDVILDVTSVRVAEKGPDRVLVSGARGLSRPETLRALACYRGGWMGEAEISYGGPNALARGQLAASIVRDRLEHLGMNANRIDLIGVNAVSEPGAGSSSIPSEVRVRLAVACEDRSLVQVALDEIESLYLCGPAGGGGVRRSVVERLISEPVLIPRTVVTTRAVEFCEPSHV